MAVEPITDIDYQGTVYSVDELPQMAKHLVMRMNEWREKEAELASDIEMVQTALEMLNLSLTEQLAKHVAEKNNNTETQSDLSSESE